MAEFYNIINASLEQLPATILEIFNLSPPPSMPPSISQLTQKFNQVNIASIIFILIDNFDLFQVALNKPESIIHNSEAILLLNTKDAYTPNILEKMFSGGSSSDFHLIRYLNLQKKSSYYIARKEEIDQFAGSTPSIAIKTDTEVWVEASKFINNIDFLFMHFDGLDILTNRNLTTDQNERAVLLEKLMKRTDQWINTIIQRIRPNTLVLIMGSKGIKQLEVKYSEEITKLESGSVPCVFIINKK